MMQGALIAVLLAVGFLGIAAANWNQTVGQSMQDIRDRAAAEHLEVIRHGAEAYVAAAVEKDDSNDFDALKDDEVATVTVADIVDEGYLPAWYDQSSPLGQDYMIEVRRDPATLRLHGIVVTDMSGAFSNLEPELAERRASAMAAISGSAGGRALDDGSGNPVLAGSNDAWQEDPSSYSPTLAATVQRGALAGLLDVQGGAYHWVRLNETCTGDAPTDRDPDAAEQAAVACPASCGTTSKQVPRVCVTKDWSSHYDVECHNAFDAMVPDENCDAGSRPSEIGGTCISAANSCGPLGSIAYPCTDYSACAWDSDAWGACSVSAAWNPGAWGACSNSCGAGSQSRSVPCDPATGSQTRTVTCINNGAAAAPPTVESDCLQPGSSAGAKPDSSQACTETACAGTAPASTQSCTDYGGCSYGWQVGGFGACGGGSGSWGAGSWGACSNTCGSGSQTRTVSCNITPNSGSQTRSVQCVRSDGVTVADSYCTATKPATSQACTPSSVSCGGGAPSGSQSCSNYAGCTYAWKTGSYGPCGGGSGSWSAGGWGGCNRNCGGGTQTRSISCNVNANSGSKSRSVYCRRSDGTTVADSYCGGGKPASSASCTPSSAPCGSAPATSQSCNTQACIVLTRLRREVHMSFVNTAPNCGSASYIKLGGSCGNNKGKLKASGCNYSWKPSKNGTGSYPFGSPYRNWNIPTFTLFLRPNWSGAGTQCSEAHAYWVDENGGNHFAGASKNADGSPNSGFYGGSYACPGGYASATVGGKPKIDHLSANSGAGQPARNYWEQRYNCTQIP